jgi:hypothetical protein
MVTKLAALAALGIGSVLGVGVGVAPASGGTAPASHDVRPPTAAASPGCRRAQSPTPSDEGAGLAAVQFVSTTTGWVVGADRVLATTDGGAVWVRQRASRGADYSAIDAIDAQHAWVVGRHQLIRTTDGGASWQRLPEPCPAVSSVHFISASRGFAVSGERLLTTTDGGARWRRMPAPARVQSVCFTSAGRGWLGAGGRIYRTVTGGASWSLAVRGSTARGVRGEALAEVECAGPDAGWAEVDGPGVAMSQVAHIGYHLSGSGSRAIFAEQQFRHPGVRVRRGSPGSQPAAFSAVDASDAVYVDYCSACGVGAAPLAIATDDGRALDRVGRVRHLSEVYGAAFTSVVDGWAVGGVAHPRRQGDPVTWRIVRTADGGRQWTTQYVL